MSKSTLDVDVRYVANGEGWELYLKRTVSPAHFHPDRRPVVIVPGYGMNTFILGYHPNGTPMERCLAEAGAEVWSACLRFQGDSRRVGARPAPPSLRSYAEVDLPAILEAVLDGTASSRRRANVIGCSLGGSVAYALLALHEDPPVGAVITIGAPLRWDASHPLMRVAFRSRRIAGLVHFRGTRQLARVAFPLLARLPGALSMYVNRAHLDFDNASELTRSVDDPHPRINIDMVRWFRARDLVLRGLNVTRELARYELPLLIVLANADGIVPPAAALSALSAWGGDDVTVLEVGTPEDWYAHADLFIAPEAPRWVFEPMSRWMARRDGVLDGEGAGEEGGRAL